MKNSIQLNFKRSDKYVALPNLSIHSKMKKFLKNHTKTVSLNYLHME